MQKDAHLTLFFLHYADDISFCFFSVLKSRMLKVEFLKF